MARNIKKQLEEANREPRGGVSETSFAESAMAFSGAATKVIEGAQQFHSKAVIRRTFIQWLEDIIKKAIVIISFFELGKNVWNVVWNWYRIRHAERTIEAVVVEDTTEFTALKLWAAEKILANPGTSTYAFELSKDGKQERKLVMAEDMNIPYNGKFIAISRMEGTAKYESTKWKIGIPQSLAFDFYDEYFAICDLNGHTVPGIYDWEGWHWVRLCDVPMNRQVILPEGELEQVCTDAARFLMSKDWYESKGIPWRRGYLLYGVPGGGKTSMVIAMAGLLKKDVYVIGAKDCSSSFAKALQKLPQSVIILIEDVDALFGSGSARGNENSAEDAAQAALSKIFDNGNGAPVGSSDDDEDESTTMSLSEYLNAVDGVTAHKGGRLLVLTTNHRGLLDPAVIRKGRIDVEVEFNYATDDQLIRLARRMLDDKPGEKFFKKALKGKKQMTMAEAENLCLVEALTTLDKHD